MIYMSGIALLITSKDNTKIKKTFMQVVQKTDEVLKQPNPSVSSNPISFLIS